MLTDALMHITCILYLDVHTYMQIESWRGPCLMNTSCTIEMLCSNSCNITLQWRHNGHTGVSNHQPHHCLLNRVFGCWSKKTSKPRVTGLCAGNSPGTGEFPAQMASNAETFPFDDVIMNGREFCCYISFRLAFDPFLACCIYIAF